MALSFASRGATPRSTVERLWLLGGAVAALLLLVIGYFFFIAPQRAQTSDVDGQVTAARQQIAALQTRIDSLRAQNRNLARYEADFAAAQRALPSTSGMSDFLRSLQTLGSATQTRVSSLTVGTPTDVGTAASGPKIYAMTITAQASGTPTGLTKFLEQLQQVQPRAVLITQLTEGNGATNAGSTASTMLQLTMQAFVAPANAQLAPEPAK